MSLQENIRNVFAGFPAEISEKRGVCTAKWVVAERKSFLSNKKLVYTAIYRIDEAKREVRFTELLKETGFGLSGGGDIGSSPGFGLKKETYRTGSGGREGTIEEQSNLFGKKYSYVFDFNAIRSDVEKRAREAGFTFKYQITPIGL